MNSIDNLEIKTLAKEILKEENYIRFMKSYKFTFWFQAIGILAGFIVPSIIFLILFKDTIYLAFSAAIGIFWMISWLIISQCIPQTRIYRQFAKWYRKKDTSIKDLEKIFS